jgi:hypothetical protein
VIEDRRENSYPRVEGGDVGEKCAFGKVRLEGNLTENSNLGRGGRLCWVEERQLT